MPTCGTGAPPLPACDYLARFAMCDLNDAVYNAASFFLLSGLTQIGLKNFSVSFSSEKSFVFFLNLSTFFRSVPCLGVWAASQARIHQAGIFPGEVFGKCPDGRKEVVACPGRAFSAMLQPKYKMEIKSNPIFIKPNRRLFLIYSVFLQRIHRISDKLSGGWPGATPAGKVAGALLFFKKEVQT